MPNTVVARPLFSFWGKKGSGSIEILCDRIARNWQVLKSVEELQRPRPVIGHRSLTSFCSSLMLCSHSPVSGYSVAQNFYGRITRPSSPNPKGNKAVWPQETNHNSAHNVHTGVHTNTYCTYKHTHTERTKGVSIEIWVHLIFGENEYKRCSAQGQCLHEVKKLFVTGKW